MRELDCCIVVPLNKGKAELSCDENLSLEQLYKILGRHPIYLIGPSLVNWQEYKDHAEKFGVSIGIKTFDNGFGTSAKHNRLLLSTRFYRAFKQYRFMLIYHTDAYVFKDELEEWCRKGYDYIGAPWFEGWHKSTPTSKLIGGGNGGFSLRNICTSRKIIPKMLVTKYVWKVYRRLGLRRILSFQTAMLPFRLIFEIRLHSNGVMDFLTEYGLDRRINEDLFFGYYFPHLFSDFKLAPPEEDVKFGFEMHPAALFEMNGRQLPFGCHAWKRYDWSFWQKYIK